MNERVWAAPPLAVDTAEVLASIERGVTVTLIATFEPELFCCQQDDRIHDILINCELKTFDYLPVRGEERIVGLLPLLQLRAEKIDHGQVVDQMMPLDERHLISGDVGILTFIEQAEEQPCWLVFRGTKIDGIVTLSDLQKLPIRPALFLLITHLELLMGEVLRRRFQKSDEWMETLSSGRKTKVREKWDQLNEENLAIDLISASDFCDKRTALLASGSPMISRNGDTKELKAIEKLRDSLAHSSDFALTQSNAFNTVSVVKSARRWVNHLQMNRHTGVK